MGLSVKSKAWMKENGYDTYSLQSVSEKVIRGYFMKKARTGKHYYLKCFR